MGAELIAAAAIIVVAGVAGLALSSMRSVAAGSADEEPSAGGEVTAPFARSSLPPSSAAGSPPPPPAGPPPLPGLSPAVGPAAGPPAARASAGAMGEITAPIRPTDPDELRTDPGRPAPTPGAGRLPPGAAEEATPHWGAASTPAAPAAAPPPEASLASILGAPTPPAPPAGPSLVSILGVPEAIADPPGPPPGTPTFGGLPMLEATPAAPAPSPAASTRTAPPAPPSASPPPAPPAPPPDSAPGTASAPAALPGLGPPPGSARPPGPVPGVPPVRTAPTSSAPPPASMAPPLASRARSSVDPEPPRPTTPPTAGGLRAQAGLGDASGALLIGASRLGLGALFAIAGWIAITPMVPIGPGEFVPPGIGFVVGAWLPNLLLERLAMRRRRRIERQLPDCLDVVVTCLEGGLGLDLALRRTAKELRGATPELAQELGWTVDQWTAGMDRSASLVALRERTGVEALVEFLASVEEAARHGTSIGSSLSAQAEALRRAEAARVEAWARKLPTQVMFAMLVFLLPPVFVLLLGSSLLSASRAL